MCSAYDDPTTYGENAVTDNPFSGDSLESLNQTVREAQAELASARARVQRADYMDRPHARREVEYWQATLAQVRAARDAAIAARDSAD